MFGEPKRKGTEIVNQIKPNVDVEKVRIFCANGLTQQQIADKFGVSRKVIGRIMQKNNIVADITKRKMLTRKNMEKEKREQNPPIIKAVSVIGEVRTRKATPEELARLDELLGPVKPMKMPYGLEAQMKKCGNDRIKPRCKADDSIQDTSKARLKEMLGMA